MKSETTMLSRRTSIGILTTYMDDQNRYHREDGPAYIEENNDGSYFEEWYYNGVRHRMGGPSITLIQSPGYWKESGPIHDFHIEGHTVSYNVHEWLYERNYTWETMSGQEKWELELFMRSL